MIFQYISGRAHLDGRPCAEAGPFHLTPDNNHRYSASPGRGVGDEDRQSIEINLSDAEVVINASWYGECPLFYYLDGPVFILSSSFEDLCSGLGKLSRCLEFDRTGVLEMMLLDSTLRSRTLFKNVRQVISGTRTRVDLRRGRASVTTTFVLPFDRGDRPRRDPQRLLDQAADVLSNLIDPAGLRGRRVVLPLSGGFDSRLLACLLKRHDVPFHAVTFGVREGMDPLVAKRVAKRLGIPIAHLVLEDAYYKTYGDEITWLTGGQTNHRHCHLYAALAAHDVRGDDVVLGYLGGTVAGDSQPPDAARYDMTPAQALHGFLSMHARRAGIARLWSKDDRAAIMDDLRAIMDDNLTRNLPCHLQEYFHNVDRQYSLIAHVLSPIERFGRVIRPYACREYVPFFNSLPYEHRVDRRLFRQAAARLFPSAYAIENQKHLFDRDSFIGRVESKLSAWYTRLSYASVQFTRGQFVLPDPKALEKRHPQLLCTILRKDLSDAVENVSDLLGMDLRYLKGIPLTTRSEINAQYRTLSLHILMRQLEARNVPLRQRCT